MITIENRSAFFVTVPKHSHLDRTGARSGPRTVFGSGWRVAAFGSDTGTAAARIQCLELVVHVDKDGIDQHAQLT